LDIKNEKDYKEKLLMDNPETLFADCYKNRKESNLIFYTDHPWALHTAIRAQHSTLLQEGGYCQRVENQNTRKQGP
jgi:hypothetical protein